MANNYSGVIELHGPEHLTMNAALDLGAKAPGYDYGITARLEPGFEIERFAFETHGYPDIWLFHALRVRHPLVRFVFDFKDNFDPRFDARWDSDQL